MKKKKISLMKTSGFVYENAFASIELENSSFALLADDYIIHMVYSGDGLLRIKSDKIRAACDDNGRPCITVAMDKNSIDFSEMHMEEEK